MIVHAVLYQLYSPTVTAQSNTNTGHIRTYVAVASNFHCQYFHELH